MDTGALFIGFSLAFCAGAVLAMVVAVFEIRKLKGERERTAEFLKGVADRWREAYNVRTDQLEATRIALKEAQKNDRRGPNGRFIKAS